MSDMRTEEEQVEAIKNWWKENGRSTVIGVVIAAVAVFGWRGWQDYERETAEAASALYQSLVQQSQLQPGESLSDERLKSTAYIANQLKTDYSGSTYSLYASLWLAKHAVDQGHLDQDAYGLGVFANADGSRPVIAMKLDDLAVQGVN